MAGRLLLLPCGVADGMALATLPAATIEAARGCGHFLAENARTARAFLKEVGHPRPLIPATYGRTVFAAFHNMAHPGVKASGRMLGARVVWPGMKSDVPSSAD